MQFLLLAALLGASANAAAIQSPYGPGENCPSPSPGPSPFPGPSPAPGPAPIPLPCGATSSVNYTTVQGDTLGSIAKAFSSGICDIAKLNNITNVNYVQANVTLIIPKNCTTPDNTACLPPPPPPPTHTCVVGPPSTYTVRTNDTLTLISNNFNITLQSLEAANPAITNPDLIFPGQVLNITVCPFSSCIQGPYTIQSGDTFYDLAVKYHSTVGQIEAVNPNVDPLTLQPGQNIVLVQDCKNGTSAAPPS